MTRSLASGGWSWDVSVILKSALPFTARSFYQYKDDDKPSCFGLCVRHGDNLQKASATVALAGLRFIYLFPYRFGGGKRFMNSVSLASDTLDNAVIFVNALIPRHTCIPWEAGRQ